MALTFVLPVIYVCMKYLPNGLDTVANERDLLIRLDNYAADQQNQIPNYKSQLINETTTIDGTAISNAEELATWVDSGIRNAGISSLQLRVTARQHRIPGYELTKLPRLILCPLWPDEDPYHLLARHIASQASVFDAGFEPIVHRLQAHRSEYFEVSTSLTALIYNICQRIWNCRSLPKGSTGNLVVTIVTGKEQGGGVDLVSEAIQAWIAQEVVMCTDR
ncbi:hypothetical protein BKA70DRAFT_1239514 [Coprinopsis sp. MPI-PUGE-AT-0042]|nr:hypothetical protein BKA70DRAFT_1239514 [Coprinopsis sp. MPI-PUGE-AT-0042]